MQTRWFSIVGILCILILLAACGGIPQTDGSVVTVGGEITTEVWTSEPGVVDGGSSGGATPGAVITAAPDQDTTITLDNNQQTLRLKIGQRFLLQLGEGYTWNLALTDESVAARVKNIMVVHGAQGVYEALKPGNTTLTADGEPGCRQSKPACMMPNRLFTLTIEVVE